MVIVVIFIYFHFRYFTQPDNLRIAKDKLIQEVVKMEKRAATASEGPGAAVAEPTSKKRHQEGSSSLGSILDEILEEHPVEAGL